MTKAKTTARRVSKPYSEEVRERAVRLVREQRDAHDTEWAAIRSIAEKIGCTAETLRLWVRQAERDAGKRPGLATDERELKRANEILRTASALFAAAELDRHTK